MESQAEVMARLKSGQDEIARSKAEFEREMAAMGKKSCKCESTVLIVDDNAFNLIPLEAIMEAEFNLKCDQANDGKEAFEMYRTNLTKECCRLRYKLIVSDI